MKSISTFSDALVKVTKGIKGKGFLQIILYCSFYFFQFMDMWVSSIWLDVNQNAMKIERKVDIHN